MTDDDKPPIPGSIEANDLVVRDSRGDPVLAPDATRMIERESYERVIEGLRISADAAQHLAAREPQAAGLWRATSGKLDQVRRIAVQKAGLGLVLREQETRRKDGGDVMRYKDARARFREGLQQASGGARQLATCFRADIGWSTIGKLLEDIEQSMMLPGLGGLSPKATPASGLILPAGYRRQ